MRISKLSILIFALFLPLSMQAQKKKQKKNVKKPVVVVEPEPLEDPRIVEMRELTQQIVFIDSVVVSKQDFLSKLRLNAEMGTITAYDSFFNSEGHDNCYVYLNEMGNKCYFSDEDDHGRMQLYTRDKLGNEWSESMELKGIYEGITEANYPFMLSDGTTFYFAAKGEESIGGYDIFVTRYDAEDGKFLKPENIGMPFNSEANDYMYVIDEFSNIGYFATDRRQPEGKVCVYVFIPSSSRRTYDTESYTSSQIRGFADISRIADTWGNGAERKAALERLKSVSATLSDKPSEPEINFVINDKLSYTSVSQFRNPESLNLFRELTTIQQQRLETEKHLEKSRAYFAKCKPEDKQLLRKEILEMELKLEKLHADAKSTEKLIRNAENNIIN